MGVVRGNGHGGQEREGCHGGSAESQAVEPPALLEAEHRALDQVVAAGSKRDRAEEREDEEGAVVLRDRLEVIDRRAIITA